MPFIAGAVCDFCGELRMYTHVGKTYVARWLRQEEWTVSRKDGKDVVTCPECRRRAKKKGETK